MNSDSTLSRLLNSYSVADSIETMKIKSELTKHGLPYYNNLNKIGFTSLIFIIEHSKSYFMFNTGNGKCMKYSPEKAKILPLDFNEIPLAGTNICNGFIDFQYIFPIQSNIDKKPKAWVKMGFEIQLINEILANNLPKNRFGYLIHTSPKALSDSTKNNHLFKVKGIAENVYTDQYFGREIFSNLHEKDRIQINSFLNEPLKNETTDQFSIYLHSKKHETISFSKLNYLDNCGYILVLSACSDPFMDKSQKKNNLIFLIICILICMVTTALIYHYINRVNLLNEKVNVERLALKLKEQNQSKDKFFSILAHDLKNPFNGIMGMSGYLIESYSEINDSERIDIINDINISSKNAFNLLQNLLEWTRTQSGQIKNIPVKIEPKNIIELSLETVLNPAKNKEIEIIQIIQTDQNGYADENLVSTVLRNLFTNAVKFSSRKSRVEVFVKQFENELVFCVKDTGIGLRSDEIDKLFRIDIHFNKKGTEDETGTGLGLKICKEFVEYCNGRIWVVSEPKVGSSFFFTIPIYK